MEGAQNVEMLRSQSRMISGHADGTNFRRAGEMRTNQLAHYPIPHVTRWLLNCYRQDLPQFGLNDLPNNCVSGGMGDIEHVMFHYPIERTKLK